MIWRIRDQATFHRFRHEGRRVRQGPLTVTWVPGPADEPPRVAYALGKRVGGAVVRNRLRRRLRAAVRELEAELVPGAYLVSASPDATQLTYADLRSSLAAAVGSLTARAAAVGGRA